MASNSFGQTEQDRALRLIEVQMEKAATMLESIQSSLKKASSLAKGQATEQFEYGAAGQLIGSMIEGDLDRWRRQAGLVDESDEQRERRLRNAEAIVNTWIEVTARALESIGPELVERFVPLGRFVERPRSARERVVNLEKHLAEHARRLCSIYKQVRLVGVPAKAPQPTPADDEAALDAEHLSASERYVFRKSGEVWEIAYEAPKFHLKDVKGLAYIACLLCYPRKEFHVLELSAAIEKNLPDDDAALYGKMTGEQLDEEGLSVPRGGGGDAMSDERAMRQYTERLREIREERERARQVGDDVKEMELDDEVDGIEQEFARSKGLGGRSRPLGPTDEERARSNIQQLIKFALSKIQEEDPALFRHLKSSIHTGSYCVYRPDTPIQWSL